MLRSGCADVAALTSVSRAAEKMNFAATIFVVCVWLCVVRMITRVWICPSG